ncbi:hypothetical protein AWJ20_1392 [Sugiyamaella lignohabitans]|uniref:NAD-dependent epimerase/dehydratase domain-containing protein n=1 Tax=Sugiyamaella lignohabitans TaxID=796027 RepID=A0A167DNN3_9ASCO|nr:uncharacterized protein AWJ20_1392 [Sugiyamaella lignohabitans]ANB13111.1 hypothetical protein AWJ20_1392 [Sugiyamaella lignohabitans]
MSNAPFVLTGKSPNSEEMSSILITGAGGFLGNRIAQAILQQGNVKKLVLTDVVTPKFTGGGDIVHCVQADLVKEPEKVITEDLDKIFLLHGIMSGGAEADFELGMKVNLDATRSILEILRKNNQKNKKQVRVVFTSSCACFGGNLPDVIDESTALNPQSSYGTEKAICELLINDYSRRGFLDGVILRYPTVVVRPGPPSSATSSFASGIIREPLNNEEAILPVSKDLKIWVAGTNNIVRNSVLASTISTANFGPTRVVNLPGVTVTVHDIIAALVEVGGKDKVKYIVEKEDPVLEKIVTSWPDTFNTRRAIKLGFLPDPGFKQAVTDFIEEETAKKRNAQ